MGDALRGKTSKHGKPSISRPVTNISQPLSMGRRLHRRKQPQALPPLRDQPHHRHRTTDPAYIRMYVHQYYQTRKTPSPATNLPQTSSNFPNPLPAPYTAKSSAPTSAPTGPKTPSPSSPTPGAACSSPGLSCSSSCTSCRSRAPSQPTRVCAATPTWARS